jgi:3-oxoacyl-[acyl-carrier protein] reductase
MGLLGGQVAIVTGGGQGIGLAVAESIVVHGGEVTVAVGAEATMEDGASWLVR